jgi:chromosome segregation ATPase
MARKAKEKADEAKPVPASPLENLEVFEPGTEPPPAGSTPAVTGQPQSPLGPPRPAATSVTGLSSIELLLQEAQRRIESLQAELQVEKAERRELEREKYRLEALAGHAEELADELEHERQARLGLEREVSAMEVEIQRLQILRSSLDEERARRLSLERQVGILETRTERFEEISSQLNEERQARIKLEREKSTLDVEVQHLRKMEALLAEERQARANAQLRASAAEARLAQMVGERGTGEQQRSRSMMDRLRGR